MEFHRQGGAAIKGGEEQERPGCQALPGDLCCRKGQGVLPQPFRDRQEAGGDYISNEPSTHLLLGKSSCTECNVFSGELHPLQAVYGSEVHQPVLWHPVSFIQVPLSLL